MQFFTVFCDTWASCQCWNVKPSACRWEPQCLVKHAHVNIRLERFSNRISKMEKAQHENKLKRVEWFNGGMHEWRTFIMFVTVRNPTMWAYTQLLCHTDFNYRNKSCIITTWVQVWSWFPAPVTGSVALQVVVKLTALCLSALFCCWIKVFIVQFITFTLKHISLSQNM